MVDMNATLGGRATTGKMFTGAGAVLAVLLNHQALIQWSLKIMY